MILTNLKALNSRNLSSVAFRCYSSAAPKRPSALTDEIIRVDHAGELGADRIYAGQMAVLGNGPMGKTIAHMWEQEKEHRRKFEVLINQHRVRPTVMTPIWNIAGFALGAGSYN
uniref:Uncharacterized protein n=1 Tax=Stomoxys calcitrans TaxID=35570 RepID=A0A1I8NT86_STOCA